MHTRTRQLFERYTDEKGALVEVATGQRLELIESAEILHQELLRRSSSSNNFRKRSFALNSLTMASIFTLLHGVSSMTLWVITVGGAGFVGFGLIAWTCNMLETRRVNKALREVAEQHPQFILELSPFNPGLANRIIRLCPDLYEPTQPADASVNVSS